MATVFSAPPVNVVKATESNQSATVYTVPSGRFSQISIITDDPDQTLIDGVELASTSEGTRTFYVASGTVVSTSSTFSGTMILTAIEFNNP